MAADQTFRQAQLPPKIAHFILEKLAQRFNQFQLHPVRQTADIMMRLNGDAWPTNERDTLDYIGIQSTLGQELHALDPARLGVKNIDE